MNDQTRNDRVLIRDVSVDADLDDYFSRQRIIIADEAVWIVDLESRMQPAEIVEVLLCPLDLQERFI